MWSSRKYPYLSLPTLLEIPIKLHTFLQKIWSYSTPSPGKFQSLLWGSMDIFWNSYCTLSENFRGVCQVFWALNYSVCDRKASTYRMSHTLRPQRKVNFVLITFKIPSFGLLLICQQGRRSSRGSFEKYWGALGESCRTKYLDQIT